MAHSNFQKSAYTARVDASEIASDPATIRANTTRDEEANPNPSAYIGNVNDYDRLEMVLKYMRDTHRWSINDLLRHMVTAKPGKPYDRTIKTRAKLLSRAIVQDQVAEQLVRYSGDLRELGVSGLVERLRNEINRLGSSVTGLGNFDPEASVHGLDIPHIYNRIQEAAPELCKLLLAPALSARKKHERLYHVSFFDLSVQTGRCQWKQTGVIGTASRSP